MRRRAFINLLGGAVLWPLALSAQQQAMPVIGFLSAGSPDLLRDQTAMFRQGLIETGYIEHRNVAIEYRWAEGHNDRLAALAAELVRRPVAVIAATGGDPSVLAAKAATTTIPIVFAVGIDPVKTGLVSSLNRPGGNLTGISQFTSALEQKRLELLHELVPAARVIGALVNPTRPDAQTQLQDVQEAARALGREIVVVNASSEGDIDTAFATLVRRGAAALLVGSDPLFTRQREMLVALAARHAVPAIYQWREFAAIGGLMSYGTSLTDAYRQNGIYVGRILKGEKPADLPVQQSTKVELVLNLKTAKTLGVTIPLPLLGRADEVIE
ncbi:MAG: ABC transporter substrate-binding protein [Xanthobacteraceae bacterium]